MKQVLFGETTGDIFLEHIIRDEAFVMTNKHAHREYEIYYLAEGQINYFIGNQTYLLKTGCLVVINRYQVHKTNSVANHYHRRYLIEFEDDSIANFLEVLCDLYLPDYFLKNEGILELDTKEQKYVEALFAKMGTESQNKKKYYEAECKLKLLELLIFIQRKKLKQYQFSQALPVNTPKHQKVHEVAEYIEKNCFQPLSLEGLSARFFINKSYLSRIFGEITGFTTSEYINVLKVRQAQKLLTTGEYSITKIALTLGYSNRTYFERVFKKYTETSPLRYRKKYLLINQKMRDKIYD